jgi:putative PIN family toxin of toxin-antitoxin system
VGDQLHGASGTERLDANCLVSGIASPRSASGRILRNVAIGKLLLVASDEIEAEYYSLASKDSIRRLFNRHGVELSELIDVIEEAVRLGEKVEPKGTPPPCRDPKDRKYLHCALFAGVRWLVTRDRDLLEAAAPRGVAITTPENFVASMQEIGFRLDR